jgi:exopolysaccharide transport family protein
MLMKVSYDRPTAERPFDPRHVLHFLWRRWKLIAAIAALTLLAGTISLLREVPRYTATTLVLLDPHRDKPGGADGAPTIDLDFNVIESQIAIVQSAMLLRRVVEKERLYEDPEFGVAPPSGKPAPSLLAGAAAIFSGGPKKPDDEPVQQAPEAKGDEISAARIQASVGALMAATSVGRAGQAYVLSISVVSVDPARAARLANAITDAYAVDQLDARLDATKRASAWFADRLEELKNQVREAEEAVARYRDENGLTQTSPNITLNQQQLADLNARLVAARTEVAEKKARADLLQALQAKGGKIDAFPELASSGFLAQLRAQEADVARREADLVSRYGDQHPLVVNVRAEHREVLRAIAAEIARQAANVTNEYELAKARLAGIEQTLKEVSGQTGTDARTAITLRELERTASVNKALYEDFLQRAKATQEQSTFQARDTRVITPAVPPTIPSSPRKGRVLGISAVLGLVLGIGSAVLMELLSAGFTSTRQIEETLELPVLTSVGRLGRNELAVDGRTTSIPRYVVLKPLSRISEAMRALRSGVHMTDVDKPPKVVQITSSVPSEGKTTIALALAASAASSKLRVLFVDADLRRPSASRLLGIEGKKGLVDLLLGEAAAGEAIGYDEDLQIWTLPAGSKSQSPADLMSSERMKGLIETFRTSFDYVVIDSPPVAPVVDTLILSRLVDKTVFVVRWGSTHRDVVQRSLEQLSPHREVAGIVLNMVNQKSARRYPGSVAGYGSVKYDRYYTE